MNPEPTGAGRSTFDLVDESTVFDVLALQPDTVFLDAACGNGRYALEAAKHVTSEGLIYAVDLWQDGIEALRAAARERALDQVHATVADISKRVPADDGEVDVCLLAAALHDLVRDGTDQDALREIARVLRHNGRLVVVEFQKVPETPGPPVEVRLAPEELDGLLKPHAFELASTQNAGPYHYLSSYQLATDTHS